MKFFLSVLYVILTLICLLTDFEGEEFKKKVYLSNQKWRKTVVDEIAFPIMETLIGVKKKMMQNSATNTNLVDEKVIHR